MVDFSPEGLKSLEETTQMLDAKFEEVWTLKVEKFAELSKRETAVSSQIIH